MAEQNLFTKYGIKEVADVTFYRIEKKSQNYEVQREIPVSSILKGIISTQKVYPINDEGIGDVDGFDAFVFKDADLITGTNYDCDDQILVRESYVISFNSTHEDTPVLAKGLGHNKKPTESDTHTEAKPLEQAYQDFIKNGTVDWKEEDDDEFEMKVTDFTVTRWNTHNGIQLTDIDLDGYKAKESEDGDTNLYKSTTSDGVLTVVKVEKETKEDGSEVYRKYYKATYTVNTVYENEADLKTGIYRQSVEKKEELAYQPDFNKVPGTHEYSYARQALMIFSKEQNLITKLGTRYVFNEVDTIFGNITFDDAFAVAPNSKERVVVVGLEGKTTYGTYDLEEVRTAINELTGIVYAKAYDVKYKNYVELVVEDEMGYYRPDFLGAGYRRRTDGTAYLSNYFDYDASQNDEDHADKGHTGDPTKALNQYKEWAKKGRGVDPILGNAVMWGDQEHYSINDAIDALRQREKNLDTNMDSQKIGISSVFGGYRVGKNRNSYRPRVGYTDQFKFADGIREQHYSYTTSANPVQDDTWKISKYKSLYDLQSVIDMLNQIALEETSDNLTVRVNVADATASNRAIYVNTTATGGAASAYIYILHNKNKVLARDKDGIFEFEDKKGNTLYYQDKIFAGVETLALVIIGNKGIIFVVNRWDTKSHDKVAWMVNDSGYLNNDEAKYVVKNGLIHTITVTDNDESFEATCEVESLKVRKVNKVVDRYVPVLFLDTLKISTLEQTGEETYATGGKGNAQLIGWDYGKEITLSLEDALFTPASMSLMWGAGGDNFVDAVKDAKKIDSMQKVTAPRSFIVPAGNSKGVPTEGETGPEAVYINPTTMQPYQDGEPITEGEVYLKWTRSVAYEGQSIGKVIEISADKFAGTYRVVGETWIREESTGKDHKYQFVIPKAKVGSERTITLEADGDPTVNTKSNAVVKVA